MPRTAADRKVAKAQHRREQAARRARAKREAAEREEARQEAIVPAAQRQPVRAADGSIIRRARVQVDGPSFVKSSALAHLFRRNASITVEHLAAANRLLKAWEEGGRSVGMGASNYGERVSAVAKSGVSEYIRAAIGRQNAAQDECRAALWFTGRHWPIIRGVVLDGMDAKRWAASRRPEISPTQAILRLVRALNRLVAFYAEIRPPDRAPRIRAAEFVVRSAQAHNMAREAAEAVDLRE